MTDPITPQSGGCLCGAVRYHVIAEPYFIAVCSCKFCQRLTGSDYNVESMFRENQFTVTKGETTVYSHISDSSGMAVHMHFCSQCGNSMFLRPDRFPDCVGIFSGTFDNPEWFQRDPSTTQYFFATEAPRGMVIPKGYHIHSGHGKALDGSLNTPTLQNETIMVGEKKNR